MNSSLSRWLPRLKLAALAAAGAVLLFGIVGYFAIPAAVRWGVETVAARELGRKVSVQTVDANPFTLRVTLRGLEIAGAPGESTPLLMVREVTVNASGAPSLWHRAPVLDALAVDGLTANLARLSTERFNFSDILDRLQARPKKDDTPARFSLNNIRVTDGTLNFDDRPVQRQHVVSELAVGIPFLSNLPTHIDVDVQPALSARVNGTALELKGETRPFDETLESSIDIRLDGLDLPGWLGYSPVALNFSIPRGTLSTDLRVAFRRAAPARGDRPATSARTLISGRLQIAGFELAAPAAQPQPLLSWKELAVMLEEVEPLARRAVVSDFALTAPVATVVRDAAGELNWVQFLRSAVAPPERRPDAAVTPGTPAPESSFAFTLKQASVRDGRLSLADDSAGSFRIALINLAAEASGLTTTSAQRGKIALRYDIADGDGSVSGEGEVGLAPVSGRIAVSARDVRLRLVARYLARVIDGTLDGSSDLNANLDFATAPALRIALQDIAVRGKAIALRGPRGSGADFDLAGLQVDRGTIDLTARTIGIGRLALDAPRAAVHRLSDGTLNWQKVMRAPPAPGAAGAADAAAAPSAPWKVVVQELEVGHGEVRLEDLAVTPEVKLRATTIAGTVRNIVSDGSERAELALRTRLGSGGTLALNGGAQWKPLAADLRVDARSLDVSAVRPYLASRLNATLARAELSGRGRVTLARADEAAPLRASYLGSARLGNLHLLDAGGENDLLRWQVLDLDRIEARVGEGPLHLSLGSLALSDFYARVIISEQGRLNLVDLFRRTEANATSGAKPRPAPAAGTPQADAGIPVDREMAGNAGADERSNRTAATLVGNTADAATPRPVIRIGEMSFTRGNVNFTDNFIKPNYTANITGLGGTVTTLASDSAEPATLTLAGRIDDDAPVDIGGRLNPLAPTLFLDIEGRTKGVDLPRLTPYSIKYAGYPIVKGKLSMEVSYKVDNGKLAANNHLFLDQLTFGEKVESPTATKLPVLLAVSLLKNSKGEIDLNLPISGTLDDPKFSVGSVIVQVIVNLLTKVVTAPFTLLAAAFGGGEELGYIEFSPGAATLKDDQIKRLDTLAKALNDRPALKLDIIGRVDPAVDAEGTSKAKFDSKLKAAKIKAQVRAGGTDVDPATLTITAEERPALIAAVYADEDIANKPRNFIGFAKTIPVPEMEALILAHLGATPEDLRALANQRATSVRNHLEAQGKVSRERLFLVEPRLNAEGIQDKGARTRVDFSLK